MFQFISYGTGGGRDRREIQIHLMFQFICITRFWIYRKYNSNTSHVPIYRCPIGITGRKKRIQIHLMFQFISAATLAPVPTIAFKYISCSNLSLSTEHACPSTIIQIHLMFQFICCPIGITGRKKRIQIHLMFQFIQRINGYWKFTGLIQIHLMFQFITFSHCYSP